VLVPLSKVTQVPFPPEVPDELASKSAALFPCNWRRYQVCRENFDSRTGEGAAPPHQSWGPLLAGDLPGGRHTLRAKTTAG